MLTSNFTNQNLDDFQPISVRRRTGLESKKVDSTFGKELPPKKNASNRNSKFLITILVIISAYLFAPVRTNILILGTDYLPHRDTLSRTDTNILLTINPLKPYVGMLSIPRDLWVNIPNYGENRINTSYFFAEAAQPGSGPQASITTLELNFGITLHYYGVIRMEGLVKVIDTIGGVEVDLPSPMGGLPAGISILDGKQALAFVRERYSADDFSRMKQGQILIMAALKKIVSSSGLTKTPLVLYEILKATDTNLPWWLIPRLGFALFRSSFSGIDFRTIDREMVTPFTTSEGAQVLVPNWNAINPVLMQMFGE